MSTFFQHSSSSVQPEWPGSLCLQPSRAGLPQVPHSSFKTVPKPYEPHTQVYHSNDTATCTNLLLVTFLFLGGKKHPKNQFKEGRVYFCSWFAVTYQMEGTLVDLGQPLHPQSRSEGEECYRAMPPCQVLF